MVRRKKGSGSLTPLELEMMQVLWRLGPSNVQAVQAELAAGWGEKPGMELAYTTVQTMLNVLHRKGRVARVMNGRAFDYSAVESRETVYRHAVRELVEKMFGGSSEELVMSLVKSRDVDPTRLAELSRALEAEKQSDVQGGDE